MQTEKPLMESADGVATPRVSIIVSTRNREQKLAQCLQYISLIQSDIPRELIVVDNGSTDGTLVLLEEFARRSPIPTRVANEPVPGGARTRNTGVRLARGEVLVFLDDDCYVHPDIIDQYWKIFEDPTVGFAGGRILLWDRTDYPIGINESNNEVLIPAGRPVPCGILMGGNLAIRKRALEDAGGFDVRMGPAMLFPAEDWEILTRVGADGWSGGYFPGPTVLHDHGQNRQDARKRIRAYNIGSGAVYLKLIANPRTRRIYLPHIIRRILGDMKFHHVKILTQLYGAILFFRQNRRALIGVMPPDLPQSRAGANARSR